MRTVPKWDFIELTFTSDRTFSNPFLDVSLSADFTLGPHRLNADGFYDGMEDGRHVWRIRFAPAYEGEWSYTTFSDLDQLDGIQGVFACVAPVSRGGLTLSPHFSNWFMRQDGTYQFIVNDGWYPHPGGVNSQFPHEDYEFQQPSESDMKLYMKTLSDHRVNLIIDIAQLYSRQETITDPSFRWPWKVVDAQHNKINKDFFNLDYYRRLDRTMQYATELDLFFAMEMLYDNSVITQLGWQNHPVNVENGGWLEGNEHGTGWHVMFDLSNAEHVKYISRYVKYTVARFSAYRNILWSIGSENGNLIRLKNDRLKHAYSEPEIPAEWYNYWGDFIARHDPHGRLRSFGDVNRQPLMVTSPHNNFIIGQDPRSDMRDLFNYPRGDLIACYQAMNEFGEFYWYYGRPLVIGEMTSSNVGNYDSERRMYWLALASGFAMGRADRHFGTVIDGRFVEGPKFGYEDVPPIYTYMRILGEFIESRGVRFWRMRPNDGLLQGAAHKLIYCLAAKDEEYIVYFLFGGRVSLNLPDCDYEWINPRTGESESAGTVEKGLVVFQAPDKEDWVLHITAKSRV
ncbi:MAG: DUF5060 domain-containing protein [Christensenellales bacterium]